MRLRYVYKSCYFAELVSRKKYIKYPIRRQSGLKRLRIIVNQHQMIRASTIWRQLNRVFVKLNVFVSFKIQKLGKSAKATNHTSELSQVVSAKAFENAYTHFIEQADRNTESKKAQVSKVPYGFKERPNCDGPYFKAQYGQGTPSAAPHMN